MSSLSRRTFLGIALTLLALGPGSPAPAHGPCGCCRGMKQSSLPPRPPQRFFPQLTPLLTPLNPPFAFNPPLAFPQPTPFRQPLPQGNPLLPQNPLPVQNPGVNLPTGLPKPATPFERALAYKPLPANEPASLTRTSEEKSQWAQAAYDRGLRAEREGNYVLARACYRNALTLYPDTPVAARARAALDRMGSLAGGGKTP